MTNSDRPKDEGSPTEPGTKAPFGAAAKGSQGGGGISQRDSDDPRVGRIGQSVAEGIDPATGRHWIEPDCDYE